MAPKTYDIITIGGGLGGAALAKVMAEHGARVLVLESTTRFKDRVRGEFIFPWGAAEARKLGIYDVIMASGGHELRWRDVYDGPTRVIHRDLATTTTPMMPGVSFYHPKMQQTLIEAATEAGAEICRGARVRGIKTGAPTTVVAEVDGRKVEIRARLVVGADGRTSTARKWGGFNVKRDPDSGLFAGVLFDNVPVPDDGFYLWINPALGLIAYILPLGQERVRAYFAYPVHKGNRLSGQADIQRFIEGSLETGVLAEHFAKAKAAGPLATFSGTSTWVEHPYRNGVVLIGDAAAVADPTFGQGLSLTLRDVRVLRDQLLVHEDWDEAGHAYVKEHEWYFGVLYTAESWYRKIYMETGPEADALRERALPLWREDPTRVPETFYSGPNQTLDEAARRRFFGEE